jgi:5-methyltetrahydrofolate--homocysteine methyltransferase
VNRQQFKEFAVKRIIRLDGATGTELAKLGMPPGISPEDWCIKNPEAILQVQRAYAAAGSDIIYTPTFGGNLQKLAEFGLCDRADEINRNLAALSRKAFPGGLIFGDIAPTGLLVEPFGPLAFEESVSIYRRQVKALLQGGVDGFAVETMMSLQEARAALIAIREEAPDYPAIVTLTLEDGNRTLAGDDPVAALAALTALGADAFGCNCSSGPAEMAKVIRTLAPYAKIPLVAKPNAGMLNPLTETKAQIAKT